MPASFASHSFPAFVGTASDMLLYVGLAFGASVMTALIIWLVKQKKVSAQDSEADQAQEQ